MMISKIAPDDGDVGPTPPLPAALEDEGQTTSIFSDISSQLNGIKILLPPSITASKSQSSAANDEFHRHALPWNRATGGTPAAIALPRTDSDVARVVRYAAEKGLGLCVAGGKHSLYASIDGIIQLNLEGLRGVTIDRYKQIRCFTRFLDFIIFTLKP